MAARGVLAQTDFARPRARAAVRSRTTAPLVVGLLVGALLLVALRVDILRMRYAKAEAVEREAELRRAQRELTVESRRLQQPGQLAREAERLGFVRPERIVRLAPAPGAAIADGAAVAAAAGDPR